MSLLKKRYNESAEKVLGKTEIERVNEEIVNVGDSGFSRYAQFVKGFKGSKIQVLSPAQFRYV
jgi:hypothetical protein